MHFHELRKPVPVQGHLQPNPEFNARFKTGEASISVRPKRKVQRNNQVWSYAQLGSQEIQLQNKVNFPNKGVSPDPSQKHGKRFSRPKIQKFFPGFEKTQRKDTGNDSQN